MIEIKNLGFGYQKNKLLFKDLNLNLKKGHIYGLLGKNGAGKTSLLKNIAGLVFPVSGDCKVNNQNPFKREPVFLRDIFYLPEEIFVPDTTADGFVKGTARFYPNFNHHEHTKYLEDFEVPLSSKLNQLSLGQQKKFMISFALACNTSVLIMDEPTNGLDIPSKAKFRKIIANAFTDDQLILISTHQVKDLENLIDSVLILNKQQIVLNKSNEELSSILNFGNIPNSELDAVLYYEESFHGTQGISRNKYGVSSRPDLELLFNGIVSENRELINYLNQQ